MNNPFFPPVRQAVPQHGGRDQQGQKTQTDPMQMIMSQAMCGFSPAGIVDRIGGPQARQARQIISGKSQSQLRDIAYNMAQQRGIDLGDLAAQMGINLPG